MFYRQKVLLALIEAFGGTLKSRDLQKYLFLFTQKCQQEKSYEFVPYKYGCFSFQSYADRRNLTESGHLAKGDDWTLNESGYIKQLKKDDAQKIVLFKKYYEHLSGNSLIKEVYRDYPYYAINSEIANRLMSKEEIEKIEEKRPCQAEPCFFTIGYEGQSFENYLNRLISNNIKLLCDVRRNPLSRKYGFSKSTLSDSLKKLGIEYVHIPELGIVSEKRQQLKTQSDYDRLFYEYEKTTLKENQDALIKLCSLIDRHKRVAITCFEADPCQCHRGRVAKKLVKMEDWEYPVEHI
ncbi:MAG: DUF488 domain-containing protein [Proteobacteria bacterium]|nr:DUF488 domain-containing protein [Pseudomonadota bacterium]MDG4548581.1 DUF488 domain-containing protein [Rickettsiales bacterium]